MCDHIRSLLRVADQTSLGSVIGVDIGAGEAQGLVPGVGGGRVLGAGAELGLGLVAGGDGVVGGAAHVHQLVADAVEDDGGVEGLLLALVALRVDGLERRLAGLAPVERLLELHRRHARPEVEAERRGLEAEERARHRVADCAFAVGKLWHKLAKGCFFLPESADGLNLQLRFRHCLRCWHRCFRRPCLLRQSS